ncbi:MAG: MarR family transcriptional regulator [Oscillospiraceae bacterium]|nr:MarR family transcriptional regulator [Oscillospiraceae bacterium]
MEEAIISGVELARLSHIIYDFVDSFYEYEDVRKDYGLNEMFTMTEVHMLDYLDHNPGITATELAQGYRRSKSLISKLVNMFEKNDYLIRVTDPDDAKKKRLFLTVKGKRLCEAHTRFDEVNRLATYKALLQQCTREEINAFYKVMEVYTKYTHTDQFRQGVIPDER